MLVCFSFLNITNAKLLSLKFLKVLWDGVWKQENVQKFSLFWQNQGALKLMSYPLFFFF